MGESPESHRSWQELLNKTIRKLPRRLLRSGPHGTQNGCHGLSQLGLSAPESVLQEQWLRTKSRIAGKRMPPSHRSRLRSRRWRGGDPPRNLELLAKLERRMTVETQPIILRLFSGWY